MKKSATYFLQAVIVLFGLGILAFLLVEPQLEGVNANASFVQTYLDDPLLAYIYLVSILVFTVLFQSLKLLTSVRNNVIFSPSAIKSLRMIKFCSFIFAGAIVAADIFIRINVQGDDDPAGAIALGFLVTFISIVIGTVATVFERILQKAVAMKSENDLTV